MKKIKLDSRGANNYLEEIAPHKYKLCTEHDIIRIIGNDSAHPEAVDPSDGPFISIGMPIPTSDKYDTNPVIFIVNSDEIYIVTEGAH